MSRFAKRPVLISEALGSYFGSASCLFQKRTVLIRKRVRLQCVSRK